MGGLDIAEAREVQYQEQTLGGQSKMEINPAINVLTA
jgi:hypothetical protein